MFDTVLIANRGAIAVRIIRTLRRLKIRSVAIYAESDRDSLHVRLADQAISLGEGGAVETYLDANKILRIAQQEQAQAIHPGYGFLSENADFAAACQSLGITFIGPRPEQITDFGLKHRARELAMAADVPLLPGTNLLLSLSEATQAAAIIGYPLMLKTTAGGGGIGMQVCDTEQDLIKAFDSVRRLGQNNFSHDGVFLEKFIPRARHIEVQVVGDGDGFAVAIGERDCSAQRRNQKVIEECPAPNLADSVRAHLQATASELLASIHYLNAGTVEFILDADTEAFYFLEVNTRLQVEHGVTEEVFGVDLVEWMLKVASGDTQLLHGFAAKPEGHAIQVRVYAEDPYKNFAPAPGFLSQVEWPQQSDVRIDHWIRSGVEVSPYFDPMLTKVIVHRRDRAQALTALAQVLNEAQLYGTQTNQRYLQALLVDPVVQAGAVTTRYLNEFSWTPARIDVISGGTQTTIQDAWGRRGYWSVGVPPSGAFDQWTFRLLNRLLNNDDSCAGLEMTVTGLSFSVSRPLYLAWGGATCEVTANSEALPPYQAHRLEPGTVVEFGAIKDGGARVYAAFDGGIQCPDYLGSKSTFTLGQFGGHTGRALRAGDVLPLTEHCNAPVVATLPVALIPPRSSVWSLRVIYGPHGAPDFFTQEDIEHFFSHEWEVHYNSSRTGVRLIGPKPEWARSDGGEAGLHPSNIHDNAYAFGTVDFTGDMPVILGPDGPSLGGFVCPATVISADLWKIGQLAAGDKLRFVPVTHAQAVVAESQQNASLKALELSSDTVYHSEPMVVPETPIVRRGAKHDFGDEILFRAAGDHFVLVEYGEQILDIRLRFRAHALMIALEQAKIPGVLDLTPGIRSLQIHYDSQSLELSALIDTVLETERVLARQLDTLEVPSRVVHLPLSWDDDACQQAITKYQQSVRKDAPWCPSNLEFIRRINGLDSLDQVKQIVYDASYLVLGLGDVYLGAPVATPIDPRHRLVTTKYNPARTWTAENSVGIGGSYLCVYGMEGPGGYQFVGRTLQMWNRYQKTREFQQPWLLQFFDQIRFYEVSHDELMQIRRDFPNGDYPLRIEETTFSLADYQGFLTDQASSISQFVAQREQAFQVELARWHQNGQFHYQADEPEPVSEEQVWPVGSIRIDSPVSGSVWEVCVEPDAYVQQGDTLLVLESMKMEIPVFAPQSGQVIGVTVDAGARIRAGQTLCVLHKGEANE